MTASLENILLKKFDCIVLADTLRRHATYRRIAKETLITVGLALPVAIGLFEFYRFWTGSLEVQPLIITMLALFSIGFVTYSASTFDFGETTLADQSTAFADLGQTYTAVAENMVGTGVERLQQSRQVDAANETFETLMRNVTASIACAAYLEPTASRRAMVSPARVFALTG